jgi:2'-5' RNA ligase
MPDERPSTLRLFVACPLPIELKEALTAVQDELRAQGARARWVRPEGIHLTLKFLGAVEEGHVATITSALERVIAPFEVRLRIDRLGAFPSVSSARLRVVWAGLSGDIDALAALAARVESALEPLGFPREGRPFAPHLTLARVPDEAGGEERRALGAMIQGLRPPPLPAIVLSEVHLMRSVLGRGGARYSELAAFPKKA